MLTPSTTYWLSRPLAPAIDGFASPAPLELLTPGTMYSVDVRRRPTGSRSSSSLSRTPPAVVDRVSTTGAAAVTSTSSSKPPTLSV